eukprot:5078076-Pyramimonas_sp.AAC.1
MRSGRGGPARDTKGAAPSQLSHSIGVSQTPSGVATGPATFFQALWRELGAGGGLKLDASHKPNKQVTADIG